MAKKNLPSKQLMNSDLSKGVFLGVIVVLVVWWLMRMMLQNSAF